jgi:integrase
LLQHGPPAPKREVPTLETFAPRFVDGHARANRHKPSGIAATESILKWHLIPTLGARRLDAITNQQVPRMKLALARLTVGRTRGVETYLMVLLGGDAGLRLGEIVALEWCDVDLPKAGGCVSCR